MICDMKINVIDYVKLTYIHITLNKQYISIYSLVNNNNNYVGKKKLQPYMVFDSCTLKNNIKSSISSNMLVLLSY